MRRSSSWSGMRGIGWLNPCSPLFGSGIFSVIADLDSILFQTPDLLLEHGCDSMLREVHLGCAHPESLGDALDRPVLVQVTIKDLELLRSDLVLDPLKRCLGECSPPFVAPDF